MTAKDIRRPATTLCSLVALLAFVGLTVSACADDEPDDPAEPSTSETPEEETPAGAYRFEYSTTKSTIEGNKPGPGSREEQELYWTCEDEACSTLLQRADSVGWTGWTVRLTPAADGYVGAHTRSGDCPENGGRYQETFTWTWTQDADGALEGLVEQEFTGCDLDGTTTREGAAAPVPEEDLPIPYLEDPAAAELAATLTTYDTAVGTVYDRFPECASLGDGTPRAARCFESMYRDWEPAVTSLATSIDAPTGDSEGGCRTAVGRLELDGLAHAIQAASRSYAIEAGNAAVKQAGKQHDFLTRVALMCVPPEDYAALGDDGRLAIDIYGAVPPSN